MSDQLRVTWQDPETRREHAVGLLSLLDHVHAVLGAGDATLAVLRANPRKVGDHMRLLVRLEGVLPEESVPPWDVALAGSTTGGG